MNPKPLSTEWTRINKSHIPSLSKDKKNNCKLLANKRLLRTMLTEVQRKVKKQTLVNSWFVNLDHWLIFD